MSDKICSVEGCESPHYAREMCRKHYARWRRHGDIENHRKQRGTCSYSGCSRPHFARGFCAMHYKRVWRHNDVERDNHSRGFLGECEVDGCHESAIAKNLCRKHYGRIYRHGTLKTTKDMSGPKKQYAEEYHVWQGIKRRCYNENGKGYKHYGGRGIKVCDRWLGVYGFRHFLEDMGPRPKGRERGGRALYSIDRIDANGDYSPENCRWVKRDVQANNKRSSILITIHGETKTLTQWSRIYGIGVPTVFARYNRGWRGEKLFSPVQ